METFCLALKSVLTYNVCAWFRKWMGHACRKIDSAVRVLGPSGALKDRLSSSESYTQTAQNPDIGQNLRIFISLCYVTLLGYFNRER